MWIFLRVYYFQTLNVTVFFFFFVESGKMTKFRKLNRPTGHRMSMLRFAYFCLCFRVLILIICSSVLRKFLVCCNQDNGLTISEAWAYWNYHYQGNSFLLWFLVDEFIWILRVLMVRIWIWFSQNKCIYIHVSVSLLVHFELLYFVFGYLTFMLK